MNIPRKRQVIPMALYASGAFAHTLFKVDENQYSHLIMKQQKLWKIFIIQSRYLKYQFGKNDLLV